MAIKELKRLTAQTSKKEAPKKEDKVKKFISKGGTLAESFEENNDDHRLTLRIPQWLMNKVDEQRKRRVGKISRNLMILEILEKGTKE